MLVYYYGIVEGSLDAVTRAVVAAQPEMTVWGRMAYLKGDELRARIDPGPFLPTKEVEVVIGEAEARAGAVYVPISWRATGAEALFPVMNADLVLQPLGEGTVEVVFRGTYKPPLRGVGAFLDRTLLHRVAEASAKTFVDELCRAIEVTVGTGG